MTGVNNMMELSIPRRLLILMLLTEYIGQVAVRQFELIELSSDAQASVKGYKSELPGALLFLY